MKTKKIRMDFLRFCLSFLFYPPAAVFAVEVVAFDARAAIRAEIGFSAFSVFGGRFIASVAVFFIERVGLLAAVYYVKG